MSETIHKGTLLDEKDEHSVIECVSCGFAHILPLPTNEDLTVFYEKEFYAVERPKYFSDTEEDLEWWMATYRNFYDIFEEHTNGRKILDVGSGPGYFLLAGQERGWNVLGIEPSPDAYEYSVGKGVPVIKDFFTREAVADKGPFDVIHASMVLEHVPDPIGMIEDMKKLLKPGGILAIFSPNDYNPMQKVLRNLDFPPYWVVPHHHVNYFNNASMKGVLEKQGLEVIDTVATFPLEFFLLSGHDYIHEPSLGRGSHHMRTKFEETMYAQDPALLNSLYRGLATSGAGREFMMIARTS